MKPGDIGITLTSTVRLLRDSAGRSDLTWTGSQKGTMVVVQRVMGNGDNGDILVLSQDGHRFRVDAYEVRWVP